MQATPRDDTTVAQRTFVRERLLHRLRELPPLTLVSAPAGYGKTALVDSWAEAPVTTHTVVRHRVVEDAGDPRSFWAAAVEALQDNGLGGSGPEIKSAEGADLRPLVRLIAGHDHDVVLVLDTGDQSLSPSVGAGLDWVIRRCGGRLMVILLTRTDPPLPLYRYRLDGGITELRASDLAFTADEAALLAARQGLHLAPADVSLLLARTGGWPAGLMFATTMLTRRADTGAALEDLRGDTGNVAEYLFTEVLSKQSEALRDFLLRTCVPDELEPGLVEALTGQPCDVGLLERMMGSNVFIERVPGPNDRYRYQSLFLEFLRGQLAFERPELVGELHRVTAGWLAEDGRVFAAIRHAAHARAWPTATDLLIGRLAFARMLVSWRNEPLRALFADLPPHVPGIAAALTRAALAISELNLPHGTGHLAVARELMSSGTAPPPPTHALACAVLAAIEASLGADTGAALEAVTAAERALVSTPSRDHDALLELSGTIAGCKARVLFERGELDAAAQALSDGTKSAEDGRLDGLVHELTGMAAVVEAANGHLRRATELALRVLPSVSDPADRLTGPGVEAGLLALAWVRVDQSASPQPEELVASAGRQPASYDSRVLASVSALLRARLLQSDREHERALAELRGADQPADRSRTGAPPTGWLARQLVVAQAASLVRLERPDEAVTLLRDLDGMKDASSDLVLHRALVAAGSDTTHTSSSGRTRAEGTLAVQVDQLLLNAEESIERAARTAATETLGRALRLAAPEQLRRPFVEAGEALQALVDQLDPTMRRTSLRQAPGTPAAGPLVLVPLTAKENEVLGYLGELLTTGEIADTMFVSVNTVRSHVRSILRKLGATRRNEAVRRAWDLGLLAPEEDSTPPPPLAH